MQDVSLSGFDAWQIQSSFPCRSAIYMLKLRRPMIHPCGTLKLLLTDSETDHQFIETFAPVLKWLAVR